MKAYFSVFRMRLLNCLQYRVAALAGVATQFFWGFVIIMVYDAFYQDNFRAQPISLEQLTTYVWLQQAFLNFVMLTFSDGELFNLITSGNVAYEYCRPCDLYRFWFAKLIAQRIAGALLRCPPLLLVALGLPQPYRLALPADFSLFMLFVMSLILGLFVLVAISMFIYISVFITLSPMGSVMLIGVLGEFFSGTVIPIPLMPEWLRKVTYVLPFRLTADLPFRIYSGNIGITEALSGIGVQIFWLLVLVWWGKVAMAKVARRVVVQGG